jgi:hypothetical protein
MTHVSKSPAPKMSAGTGFHGNGGGFQPGDAGMKLGTTNGTVKQYLVGLVQSTKLKDILCQIDTE